MTVLRLALPALALAAGLAAAAPPARAGEQVAALTPSDRATVAEVQRSLNAVRSLKSHFVQVSSNGATAEGTLWLSRPGKLRIDYAPPQHMKLVVQGDWLIQVDTRLETLTYVPLSRTPAAMLVSGKIVLGDDVKVLGVSRASGVIRVGLTRRDAEDEGKLVVVLSGVPPELRQWEVTDPQGVVTRVTLTDPETNVSIDPEIFAFDASKYERNTFQ